jgi:hypothetical protein
MHITATPCVIFISLVCTCQSCLPGYGGDPCALCTSNTYSHDNACQPCPSHTISPTGAHSQWECLAEPGFYATPGSPGMVCPAGFFCPPTSMHPVPCPASSISREGSSECEGGEILSMAAVPLENWRSWTWSQWMLVGSTALVVCVGAIVLLCARTTLLKQDATWVWSDHRRQIVLPIHR